MDDMKAIEMEKAIREINAVMSAEEEDPEEAGDKFEQKAVFSSQQDNDQIIAKQSTGEARIDSEEKATFKQSYQLTKKEHKSLKDLKHTESLELKEEYNFLPSRQSIKGAIVNETIDEKESEEGKEHIKPKQYSNDIVKAKNVKDSPHERPVKSRSGARKASSNQVSKITSRDNSSILSEPLPKLTTPRAPPQTPAHRPATATTSKPPAAVPETTDISDKPARPTTSHKTPTISPKPPAPLPRPTTSTASSRLPPLTTTEVAAAEAAPAVGTSNTADEPSRPATSHKTPTHKQSTPAMSRKQSVPATPKKPATASSPRPPTKATPRRQSSHGPPGRESDLSLQGGKSRMSNLSINKSKEQQQAKSKGLADRKVLEDLDEQTTTQHNSCAISETSSIASTDSHDIISSTDRKSVHSTESSLFTTNQAMNQAMCPGHIEAEQARSPKVEIAADNISVHDFDVYHLANAPKKNLKSEQQAASNVSSNSNNDYDQDCANGSKNKQEESVGNSILVTIYPII